MEDEQQLGGQNPHQHPHQHRGRHDDGGTPAGGTTDAQPRPGQHAAPPAQPAQPARLAHLDAEPELAAARELLITARQTEAKTLIAVLAYQDRRAREAETAGLGHHARRAHQDAATRDAARILGVTDPTASGILHAARTARTTLPTTWQAYLAGIIDTPRLRAITTTSQTLIRPHHIDQLDAAAAAAAARMTLSELRGWLRRYTARLDPAQYETDCRTARADRWVRIQHDDHAMSYLEARLPTLAAAGIAHRLRAAARGHQARAVPASRGTEQACPETACAAEPSTEGSPGAGQGSAQQVLPLEHPELPPVRETDPVPVQVQDGPEILPGDTPAPGESDPLEPPPPHAPEDTVDPRTLAQVEADLLAAWLLDGRVEGAPVEAKIALLVPEATLTGGTGAPSGAGGLDADAPAVSAVPAVSADGSFVLPASDAHHLTADPRAAHDWYQAHTSPSSSTGTPEDHEGPGPDILSVHYSGRYAPARLRDAIIFRDGVCQASGCTVPAQRCDLDHRLPYPVGPTSGANLQALCRRHHRLKSHGLLTTADEPTPKSSSPPQPSSPPPPDSTPQQSTRHNTRPHTRSYTQPHTWPPGQHRRAPAPPARPDVILQPLAARGPRTGLSILFETNRRRH